MLQAKGVKKNTKTPERVLVRALIYISSNVLLLWGMTGGPRAPPVHPFPQPHGGGQIQKGISHSRNGMLKCHGATEDLWIPDQTQLPPAAIFTQLKVPWAASIYAMDYPQLPVCLCTP